MTVEIKPDLPKYPDSKVSLKIFKNGSIQMSGIKCIQACNTVLSNGWLFVGFVHEFKNAGDVVPLFIAEHEVPI